MTDGYASEDRGVGIDGNMIFQYRVSWQINGSAFGVVGEVACAECHALIEHYMVTDDSRGANHHARAVVDAEVLADSGGVPRNT